MKRYLLVTGLIYIFFGGALLYGLFAARNAALRDFTTAESQQAWDEWRKKAPGQGTATSVERSTPRSTEPPTLVLLRDHFWACVVASLTISTALFWSIALFVRGATTGPAFPLGLSDDNPQRS